MHHVKATIQYAMSSPQDEGKKRYLDENEGVIDTSPLEVPKPIPHSHPLARNLSIKQILLSMQNDIMELEKAEYDKLVQTSRSKPSEMTKVEDQVGKYSAHLLEEMKKKTDLYSKPKVRSPQRTKSKADNSSVAILGTYVKNPKMVVKEMSESVQVEKSFPAKIPSIKVREKPTKRLEKELLMFREIFVHPKETKLEELQKKDRPEPETNGLQRAKKLKEIEGEVRKGETAESKKLMSAIKGSPRKMEKVVGGDKELKAMLEEPEILGEKEENTAPVDEVVEIVMRMFNSRLKGRAGDSFFSQQIQVQPPEGLNATVAAPLTPGGGWAPSIPSLSGSLNKASFKDLTIRAKAGVQAGDIQKEAHMSFCLGVMNEDMKRYLEAVKFYKRFFFCARLLDDPVGAGLALNRLGVVYHKARRYEKSLQFHKKHKEFADKENVFAAYYNIGITNRFLKNYEESLNSFNDALDWAIQRMDYESECVTLGQMGLTNLTMKNLEGALANFKGCYDICQKMNNNRLQLDCLLCLGYLSYTLGNDQDTKMYFELAYKCAKSLKENELAEQCLCNIGIALAKPRLTMHQSMLATMFESP